MGKMNNEIVKKISFWIMVLGTLIVILIPILKIYNRFTESNHFAALLEEDDFITLIGMGLWAVGFAVIQNNKETKKK